VALRHVRDSHTDGEASVRCSAPDGSVSTAEEQAGDPASGGMAGACCDPPPLPGLGVDEAPRLQPAPAAHHAAPMSGSDAAGATALGAEGWTPAAPMVSVAFLFVLLMALGFSSIGDCSWRDANLAVGAAVLQLVALVACLFGSLSPSSKGAARRKYGGLFLLAIVVGSELPAAHAVSPQPAAAADDMVGDIATWAWHSLQEPSPPSSHRALDNQTKRPSDPSAAGLLPKGASVDEAVLRERAAARRLLQWPRGVSDADRSPEPDPEFLKEERALKDMSKRMEAGLERCALALTLRDDVCVMCLDVGVAARLAL
jgi:hypothetical protein